MLRANHAWELAALTPLSVLVAPAGAADYLTIEEAQAVLVPSADTFEPHPLTLTKDQRKAIKRLAGTRQRRAEQLAWRARRAGETIGWVLLDDVVGKHEFITYAVALSPAGRVLGVEILSYRETHGGEVRDAAWRAVFKGKTIEDPFVLDEDVPNLSGATLSSRNLTNGVKRLLALQRVALPRD